MFVLDLMTSPSTRAASIICRRLPAYLVSDNDNSIHDFFVPPREMQHFILGATVPRHLLVATRQEAQATTDTGAHRYFFYGYIGNLLYCFEFGPTCMRDNIIADPVYGRVLGRVEAILPGQAFPLDGFHGWTLLRHKDAPSGEGGVVRRLMEPPPLTK
jgi:hypothetical protein